MVAFSSTRKSISEEYKQIINNYSKDNKTHTVVFRCSKDDPNPNYGEHAIYDEHGKQIFDIALFLQINGMKKHSLGENGRKIGLLSGKSHHSLDLEISTSSGNKVSGTYVPHTYRHSKATITLDGTMYNIIKTKLDGKKIFYWVATGTKVPLVSMKKGFTPHSFTFYPNCPEALERAILLVRSYACDISRSYN